MTLRSRVRGFRAVVVRLLDSMRGEFSAGSVAVEFGVSYRQIADAMEPGEIPDDVQTLLRQIQELCAR
jgi:hypothetical protein